MRVGVSKTGTWCKDCKKVICDDTDLVVINRPREADGRGGRMVIELCLTCWERLVALGAVFDA